MALIVFWLYTVETVIHHGSTRPSLTSGAPMTLNPYTQQQELLVIRDPMHDNTLGDAHGYHWMDDVHDGDPGSDSTKGCYFADHMYHVSTSDQSSSHTEVYCLNGGTRFSDFTYQVKVSVQQGHLGGIIFRQSPHAHFYAFLVSDKGNFILFSSANTDATVLARSVSSSINRRLGAANLLAVVAHGSKLDLFINQHHVASVTDAAYSTGLIGTIALSDDVSQRTDIAFADASIWIPSR
ncbi:hypothetical protein [Dictyobacter vulcani]|nr:hypothetical protein [Dictyobacter vulcani]